MTFCYCDRGQDQVLTNTPFQDSGLAHIKSVVPHYSERSIIAASLSIQIELWLAKMELQSIHSRSDVQQVDPAEVPIFLSEVSPEAYISVALIALLLYDSCE